MSRPRPRRGVWLAAAAAMVTAGTLVTWSATRPAPTTAPDPVQAAEEPRTTSSIVERLAEPPPAPVPVAPPVAAGELVAAAEDAAPPGTTMGVAALDVHTGELAVGGAERQFMAASLTKLLLAVDVLDQHRAEGRDVSADDLDLITRALAGSDDNAMNALWGRHDGAGAVDRVAGRLGLSATLPAGSADMWGDVLVTAADLATICRHVLRDMAPQDSSVIVGALSTASAHATDGFAQHYGLLQGGASPRRYAKQAWVPYSPAGYLLHSAGVAYDGRTGHAYAITLLSIQPYSSEQSARDTLSNVAAASLARLQAAG